MGLRLGFSGLDYNTPELDVLWENRRWVWLPSVTSFLPFLLFLLLQTQELPIPAPDPIPLSNWGLFFSAAKFLAFWGSFYDIWGQIVFVVGLGVGHCRIFSGIGGLHPPNASITSNLLPNLDMTPKTSPDASNIPLQAKLSLVANLYSTAWWSHCPFFSSYFNCSIFLTTCSMSMIPGNLTKIMENQNIFSWMPGCMSSRRLT